jgi:signal transduction histidine kinase/CheY-like chemotaxis protein
MPEQIGALQTRFAVRELIAPAGLDYVAVLDARGAPAAFHGDPSQASSSFRRELEVHLDSNVVAERLAILVAESPEHATAEIGLVRRVCLLLTLATAACVALILVVFVRGERSLSAQLAQRAAELERSNGDLARSEENLRLQTQRAEASSRAKGDFLANMSHEIRTPMNGVIGVTELLLATPLTEEQRDYAETIRKSGDSLLTIIDDILDFSKIEAGKLTIESVEFDPRAEIEDAVELVGDRAASKGLELSCAIAPDLPERVRGDPTRVRQILLNLLSNAIKFTERGEVTVRAGIEPAGESEYDLEVTVQDSGIGIPADVLPKLFQSFTQADGSTTRRFGGTGLGLAISRELARRMGGDLGVTSQSGKGSTFGFKVRIGRVTATQVDTSKGLDASVLCVDDHAACREIVELYLTPSVRRVAGAASAKEALELLARDSDFDVLLIDLRMPVTSGEELIAALPAVTRAKRVLMTAHKQALSQQTLALVHGVIHKPLRRGALLREIARVLSQGPGAEPQAPLPARAPGELRVSARVLLVEDNLVNQKVARRMLERHGCSVETAGNGREALERMAGERFDLVFMDGQMPELDGYEATRRWRELESRRSEPRAVIVAMTAHAMAGDRERCLEAGMDDYLKKPIRDGELVAMLTRWLRLDAGSNAA